MTKGTGEPRVCSAAVTGAASMILGMDVPGTD